jgi:hypothetical protein
MLRCGKRHSDPQSFVGQAGGDLSHNRAVGAGSVEKHTGMRHHYQ